MGKRKETLFNPPGKGSPAKSKDPKLPSDPNPLIREEPTGPGSWFSTSLALGFLAGFSFATAYFIGVAKKKINEQAQNISDSETSRTPTAVETPKSKVEIEATGAN